MTPLPNPGHSRPQGISASGKKQGVRDDFFHSQNHDYRIRCLQTGIFMRPIYMTRRLQKERPAFSGAFLVFNPEAVQP